jgi:hypothetical protein
MPNITRGDRMSGLLVYLVGPGRTNEHTEPYLVAGDAALMAWHDDAELNRDSALRIARHLELPRAAFDVDVTGGHVWHCSLSLRSEEGQLTDEQWAGIAHDFVARMGFDDADGTKAACRWAAVRHGLSKNGNDHVHLVVNLVREDGTKASIHLDQPRSQKAARELEKVHGLEQLESATAERATRGWAPAEREAQARARARARYERTDHNQATTPWAALPVEQREALIAGEIRTDQPRWALARSVRAAATASADEAEFVRRLRRQGVLVRPRFADGRTDVVTGYSVAARPEIGERPIWYGGRHLGRDLSLPRLRAEWPDTPTGAAEAVQEWAAAWRQRRIVRPGREAVEADPATWQECTQAVARLREQLCQVPIEDRETWARVARQTAGALAAWSARVETTPGPLAATSDALARSAQLRRMPTARTARGTAANAGVASIAGAALLLAQGARGGRATVAQTLLLRQLANTIKALHDMHRAAGEARRAAEIEAAVRRELAQVAAGMPATTGVGATPGARPQGRQPGSPVPNRLGPSPGRRAAAGAKRDQGHER